MGLPVSRVMGFLPANFQLAIPSILDLGSGIYGTDKRRTSMRNKRPLKECGTSTWARTTQLRKRTRTIDPEEQGDKDLRSREEQRQHTRITSLDSGTKRTKVRVTGPENRQV